MALIFKDSVIAKELVVVSNSGTVFDFNGVGVVDGSVIESDGVTAVGVILSIGCSGFAVIEGIIGTDKVTVSRSED